MVMEREKGKESDMADHSDPAAVRGMETHDDSGVTANAMHHFPVLACVIERERGLQPQSMHAYSAATHRLYAYYCDCYSCYR